MKRSLIVLAGLVGAVVIAQAVSGYKLVINDKAYSTQAIVVKGETYVPLKALQAAGVRSSLSAGTLRLTLPNVPGGANQVGAVEGCLNEWVFNGIWRVRATNLTPITGDRNGVKVRLEFRNGTKANGIAPSGTGWGGVQVALDDGSTVDAVNTNDVRDPPYVPGGSHFQEMEFYWDDTTRTPKKLLVVFQPDAAIVTILRRNGVSYTVPDPSLRIKLECTK